MSDQSYTTSITVDRAPAEVFDAINDVRGWWSEEIDGRTDQVGAEYRYRGHDETQKLEHLATIRVVELVPGERVVWQVLDNYMNFIDDPTEWKDTEIRFDISEKDGATEVRFTHAGLLPRFECFDVCSNAWGFFVGTSLRSLITTGEGSPISARDEVGSPG
ncbi:MAG: ATPase [Frankiales bacterium]|nr:ATPase [Frankiales bacterium]